MLIRELQRLENLLEPWREFDQYQSGDIQNFISRES